MTKFKPAHYWDSWENRKSELKKIIARIGHFPSCSELLNLNQSSLVAAIGKHGGMNATRERLGYKIIRRSQGYWDSWNNLHGELEKIINKLGHFPSERELRALGMGSLSRGVLKHGGSQAVGKRMGYEAPRMSYGWYKNIDDVGKLLSPIIKKLGHFPTARELEKMNEGYLRTGIKHHGGFHQVREKLGYPTTGRPRHYWKDWSNFEREMKQIIDSTGSFPSKAELEKSGNSAISNAVMTYYGGFQEVRRRMGYSESNETGDGSLLEQYVGGEPHGH